MTAQVLNPDSRYLGKQFLAFTLIALGSIMGGALLGWLAAQDDGPGSVLFGVFFTGGVLFWIVAAILIFPYYHSLRYEIQDDEVIVHVGIWTKSVKHVPFRTVTNIKINRGILDRVFGLGTLNIQTAGMSGKQGAEESLVGLAEVHQVYETVATRLRKYRGAMSADAASEDTGDKEPAPGQTALLEELRRIRELLEKRP